VQKRLKKAAEANFKGNFSFFKSLSAAEAHVIVELLFLLQFGTFPFEEKAICGVTSAMDGVVCLYNTILLGGRVTVSNNFTNGVRMALKSAQETSSPDI